MKQTSERFNKVYKSLVKAFMKGTLAKGDCTACAVGNIFRGWGASTQAVGQGCMEVTSWKSLFITINTIGRCIQYIGEGDIIYVFNLGIDDIKNIRDASKYARDLITRNGYTVDEIAAIEFLFEKNTSIEIENYNFYTQEQIQEDQYNGLCAVIEYLLTLEDAEQLTIDSHKLQLRTKQYIYNTSQG